MEKYYIVRGDRSSVFCGHIVERNGQEVTMTDARRIWSWEGACSLSQMANEGVKRPNECRFSGPVDELLILDAVEILTCTTAAAENLRAVPEWRV